MFCSLFCPASRRFDTSYMWKWIEWFFMERELECMYRLVRYENDAIVWRMTGDIIAKWIKKYLVFFSFYSCSISVFLFYPPFCVLSILLSEVSPPHYTLYSVPYSTMPYHTNCPAMSTRPRFSLGYMVCVDCGVEWSSAPYIHIIYIMDR